MRSLLLAAFNAGRLVIAVHWQSRRTHHHLESSRGVRDSFQDCTRSVCKLLLRTLPALSSSIPQFKFPPDSAIPKPIVCFELWSLPSGLQVRASPHGCISACSPKTLNMSRLHTSDSRGCWHSLHIPRVETHSQLFDPTSFVLRA